MKQNKLNVIIQAIACGTITLNIAPQLNGQQFDNLPNGSFGATTGEVLAPYAPAMTPAPPAMAEIEVPGSSYYIGPDGQRFTDLQQYQAADSIAMPPAAVEGGGEIILSEEPIYDGENVYPLGTFPSQEFGEQIISEATVDEDGNSVEVPGTLESGAAIVGSDGMENGIPADEVVRPDLDDVAAVETPQPETEEDGEESESTSGEALNSVVVDDDGDVDQVDQVETLQAQLDKLNTRHDRLKDRLSDANRAIEKLTQEKQKAEKIAKEAAASMGEVLAGIESRGKKAKEEAEGNQKSDASAKTKVEALKKELAQTKEQLASANKKLDQPKTADKAVSDKLAMLMTAKEKSEAGLAKMKRDSGAATSKLKRQIRDLKSQLRKADSRVNAADKKAAKTTQELEKKLSSATSKVEKAEKALADAEKESGKAEKELASKIKSMESKLKKMESSAEEKLVAKEKTIGQNEEKLASLMEKTAKIEAELEEATEEATVANKAADQAKAELAELEAEFETLSGKLANQTEALAMMESKMLQMGSDEMKAEQPADATGIAATPDPSPEPAVGSATEAESVADVEEAEAERAKRDAAMAEVNRELAQREAQLKEKEEAELKEAEMKEAEMKEAEMQEAAAKEAEMKAAAELKAEAAGSSSLASSELEDKIKMLKARRDALIIQAETKIREKREAQIDQMIADGKAADSVEVTTALDELNDSIHSSSEKLTARYRRKIEKLKQAFRAKFEKAAADQK